MNAESRADRIRRLREGLVESALDALIVTHLPNVRYLTGFSGTSGVAVIAQNDALFLTDFRYREQAESEVGKNTRVEIVPRDAWRRAVDFVADQRAFASVGYEGHTISALRAEGLPCNGGTAFRSTSNLVEQLRATKDAEEVAAIAEAAKLATEALEATVPLVRVGMRELDLAAILEAELRTRGSEWHPFQTIVASGPRTALPHARTTERRIEAGDWLLLDFGAQIRGYCADITRTYVVGRGPDARQSAVYDLVESAQRKVRDNLRAGLSGKGADALARSVFEARGFGDAFGHSLGHGLGLEVHEGPSLSSGNDDPLPAGCVVTIEPGLYFPGWGGVRLEDDVHVTDSGIEILTDGDITLKELG